jgi:hypothetical protein
MRFVVLARLSKLFDGLPGAGTLGYFATELEAALAYGAAARRNGLLTNSETPSPSVEAAAEAAAETAAAIVAADAGSPSAAEEEGTADVAPEAAAPASQEVAEGAVAAGQPVSSASSPVVSPPPLPSALRVSAWLARRMEECALGDAAAPRCENCAAAHAGTYGSGRFCSLPCHSRFNGQASSLKCCMQRCPGPRPTRRQSGRRARLPAGKLRYWPPRCAPQEPRHARPQHGGARPRGKRKRKGWRNGTALLAFGFFGPRHAPANFLEWRFGRPRMCRMRPACRWPHHGRLGRGNRTFPSRRQRRGHRGR